MDNSELSNKRNLSLAKEFLVLANKCFYKGDYKKSINNYRKSISYKESHLAFIGLGKALTNINQFEEAKISFQNSISLQENWEAFYRIALILFNTGNFDKSADASKKSISLKEVSDTYYILGYSYLQLGQYIQAADAATKANFLNKNAKNYHLLGMAQFNSGLKLEAIESYRESISLLEEPHSYLSLGEAFISINRFDDARNAIIKSLSFKENSFCHELLAICEIDSGRQSEAIPHLKKALSINPNQNLYSLLGRCLYEQGEYELASEAFQNSINQQSKLKWQPYYGKAISLIRLERYKEAFILSYMMLGDNQPWFPIFRIVNVLYDLQKYDIALKYCQETIKRYPNEFFAICDFVWLIRATKKESEHKIFLSNLVLQGSWDLIDYYQDNIQNQIIQYNNATTMRYIKYKFNKAKLIDSRFGNLQEAVRSVIDSNGLIMEFGVWQGDSISFLAGQFPQSEIYGFDSFEGLPEDWNSKSKKGHFTLDGNLPSVPENVVLVKGWFEESIPLFLESNKNKYSRLIHIDCDIYSSARTCLFLLEKTIIKGTIIIFDEYFNYKEWEEHEYKAFCEFVQTFVVEYEYISYSNRQVAVRILSKHK